MADGVSHGRPQARAKELRLELLNSERLTAHFEAHPGDLALLRHDKQLSRAAPPAHLRRLPAYLRDPATAPVKQDPALRAGAVPPAASLLPIRAPTRLPACPRSRLRHVSSPVLCMDQRKRGSCHRSFIIPLLIKGAGRFSCFMARRECEVVETSAVISVRGALTPLAARLLQRRLRRRSGGWRGAGTRSRVAS